jgi:hypothetical protein
MSEPLKLRAGDGDDLAVISAMVQDALVPLADLAYLAEDRRFVLALNRFRWDEPNPPTRTHALLTIQQVASVQSRGLNRHQPDLIHNILSLTWADGALEIAFSGGGTVRLAADALDCALEDVGEPWPAAAIPAHPDTI